MILGTVFFIQYMTSDIGYPTIEQDYTNDDLTNPKQGSNDNSGSNKQQEVPGNNQNQPQKDADDIQNKDNQKDEEKKQEKQEIIRNEHGNANNVDHDFKKDQNDKTEEKPKQAVEPTKQREADNTDNQVKPTPIRPKDNDEPMNALNAEAKQLLEMIEKEYKIDEIPNMTLEGNLHSPLYENDFPHLLPDPEKRHAVKKAFLFAWENYKKYAWGKDFLNPLDRSGSNVFSGGLTISDSLDTMWIMGLKEEFERSKNWIKDNFRMSGTYSIFEIVIRHLGAFLSAYQLSGDKVFLNKAIDIGNTLVPVFHEETGFFKTYGIFGEGNVKPSGNPEVLLSDIGSIQLEFFTLSLLTKDEKFAKIGSKIYNTMFSKYKDALYPERLLYNTAEPHVRVYSIDAMSDSFYEYLIKTWVMSNDTQPVLLDRYMKAMNAVENQLLTKNAKLDLEYITKLENRGKTNKMTHLVTFAAGMLAVGAVQKNPISKHHIDIAERLVDSYMKLYRHAKTGFMPEIVNLNNEISSEDNVYKLRPETIESIFYLYRYTGKQKYRDYAWEIFNNLEKHCKVNNGYAHLKNVYTGEKEDMMDSYFLSETLKYLYLIFSDSNLIPISQYVFNTEAHVLKIWNQTEKLYMKDILDIKNA